MAVKRLSLPSALILVSLLVGASLAAILYVEKAFEPERAVGTPPRAYGTELACISDSPRYGLTAEEMVCRQPYPGAVYWYGYAKAGLQDPPDLGDLGTAAIAAGLCYVVLFGLVLSQRVLRGSEP